MKINKIDIDKERGLLTVWTDAIENTGFHFKIDEIVDEEDLKAKVKVKVEGVLQEEKDTQLLSDKAETFKALVEQEI